MNTSSDTQWPRFEVFLQEKPGAAHQDVGSVHAPDMELALMNARDVFVRRSGCISLWIVAAENLTTRYHPELALENPVKEAQEGEEQAGYYVFAKLKPAGTQVLVGKVLARSPESALWKAQSQIDGLQHASIISVCPQAAVYKSAETEAESLFSSALDKPYRMATDFHTVTIMRKIRQGG
jgi:ring-1,2-phenylacetyl-CoA epoxidase subunit PaaB